jgi:anti-anti-sigma factor
MTAIDGVVNEIGPALAISLIGSDIAVPKGATMLSFRIQKLGDATVIRCAGRITFSYADALRIAVLRQPRIRTVVLDLADIIAVDAAGLGLLVALREWSKETGTALKLMNLTPKVEALLELTHLKSAFEVCSAREMLDLLCHAIHEAESVRFGPAIHGSNASDQTSGRGSLVSA